MITPRPLVVLLVAGLSLPLASCTSDSGEPTPGGVNRPRNIEDVPVGARYTRYIPPRETLIHRMSVIQKGPNRGMGWSPRWQGAEAEGLGDEIWTWEGYKNGRVYRGEALVRQGRVIDGYVLQSLDPAEAGVQLPAEEVAPPALTPDAGAAPTTVPAGQ